MPRGRTSLQTGHLRAPTGGINTVDPASVLPDGDCLWAYNLVPAENGLRSRLGYQEWCTNLAGVADNTVRTVLPYSGSAKNGSKDKLFACTQKGIYDCSASSTSPTLSVTFGTQTGDAGYGSSVVMATYAGRWLIYCDEENGLYVYEETGGTWTHVSLAANQPWQANTAYTQSSPQNQVTAGGKIYKCTQSGTSAGSGTGPTGTGTGIVDGTAKWDYVSATVASSIGPSLYDQNLLLTGDPANFAHVCFWKNRLWFTEKNSTRAWYLPTNNLYGLATSFDFGGRLKAGGQLVGLWNWSYDAGNGLDSPLVGIGTGGDVVMYMGTDPSQAATFSLKGVWNVGGVPAGRRIATDYGGDMLVMSLLGIMPLSKLVVGQPVVAGDRSVYATGKVSNIFNALVGTYKTVNGWALVVHPTDNALLALVPSTATAPTTQLAMSFATRGWTQYRDLPMMSAAAWNGQLYFGTADGRVCVNTGYVDNVLLSNPNAYTPVAFSLLTAYRDNQTARLKQVKFLRPLVLSQAASPVVQAQALYDFSFLEPAPPAGAASSASNTWDSAKWDAGLWAGDYLAAQAFTGASGIGRNVAVSIRGSATARTVIVGCDVFWEEGGLL